jgi:hypothetical protein
MTSTLSTYMQISGNMAQWQKITTAEPITKAQTDYYQKNIGNIKTPKDLVNNYRLFSYAMNAFGLGDMTYAKGLIQKVLEQGTDNPNALAYKLNNPNILALAKTFDFAAWGDAATGTQAVQTDVVNKYIQQTMENDQGQSNPGVQLALYFQRNAPNIKTAYNILADKKLLTVVETATGISQYISYENIDTQAKLINNAVNIKDFQDPKKLQSFIQKFSAMYDASNVGTTSQGPNVPNCLLSSTTGASNVFSFSSDLLASMQNLKLGGF